MRQGNPFDPNLCLDPVSIALVAASVASVGLGAAGAAGAFGGQQGSPPDKSGAIHKADLERRRMAMGMGADSTILGGAGGAPGQVGVRTLLGG